MSCDADSRISPSATGWSLLAYVIRITHPFGIKMFVMFIVIGTNSSKRRWIMAFTEEEAAYLRVPAPGQDRHRRP